jgi:hypothetical protein
MNRNLERRKHGELVGAVLALFMLISSGTARALTPESGEMQSDAMTRERMEAVIRKLVGSATGEPGALEFTYRGVQMACVSDTRHDRMRIIAPVTTVESMTVEQTRRVLEANFHTALDARYGASQGLLFAAYIHPLSSLTEQQIESALLQVAELARSFGSTYTSGLLGYGVQEPADDK